MKSLNSILFSCFLVLGQALSQETYIASPNVGGDAGSDAAFNVAATLWPTMRYQQIYGASDFTRRMPDGGYINGLRLDVASTIHGGRPFAVTLPAIQFNLSTTTRAVDGLSAVFSENVGADDTVVRGLSALTLEDRQNGGADIIITFDTPFFYDPREGNLLLDIFNFGGGSSSPFNANRAANDTTSSVYSAGSVNDSSGIPNTIGLVTIFTVTPVPEPSSLVLIGLAVSLAAGFHFRRHKR
jgi:PEP-CTERM motif